jgi:cell division protein FtsW (lipid II flippase)
MPITHSTADQRAAAESKTHKPTGRWAELLGLFAASLLTIAGLLILSTARDAGLQNAAESIAAGRIVDLTEVVRSETFLARLEAVIPNGDERRFVAGRLAAWLNTPDGSGSPRRRSLQSVSVLGSVTVAEGDLPASPRMPSFEERFTERRDQLASNPDALEVRVPLLTASQLSLLRGGFVARGPADYRRSLLRASGMFLLAFYFAHAWLAVKKSAGDPLLLPIIHLLCGFGLVTMASLRDPLRDPMLFTRFAQGVTVGCVLLAAVSTVDFQRSLVRRLSYVPLVGAVLLSLLLIGFGSGPGTSDAKVNLMGVQPVEAIRVLVVLFLAGYFANRWEFLRALKETRIGAWRLRFDIPRLDYLLPVVIGMTLVLLFFFLQKDLGPAMVLACVFLALYGVARGRTTMVALGLLVLVGGFAAGYAIGYPHTVVQRVQMWWSPWDNPVRGGDQIAHALWAFGTGAVTGTGIGLGDSRTIPAGHTDLILAALGEEMGLLGLIVVFALNAILGYRALRIARRAPGDYALFLALGLTLGIFLQLVLISAGILGLMPLTGVTTPFLSYGRSSMIANFFAFGVLLAVSHRAGGEQEKEAFERPIKWIAVALAAGVVIVVGRIAFIQTLAADHTVAATALTIQADGVRRFEYNPRLLAAAQQIVRGTISDRNGIPLATSRVADLQPHAAELVDLGMSPKDVCPQDGVRCYPFGGLTYHLLGDWRSHVNWAAANTSFIERDEDKRLRGYDDHASVVEVIDPQTGRGTKVIRRDLIELVPLLRHRYQPDHEAVRQILDRPRDIRTSIDIRLQLKVASLLQAGVDGAGQKEGAAVVLSPDGDVLASVSYPWPVVAPGLPVKPGGDTTTDDPDARLLDRARYGMYPPGSSFKIVTATAAMRKDPSLMRQTFVCERLPDGRVGTRLPGWGRPIRDDLMDPVPHGRLDMERGLIVSCNAYFAQLGLRLGAAALQETASLFEISLSQPESAQQVRDTLPFAAYGQGQVLATPFKMARVAATLAADGAMPQGRWIIDETNRRNDAPRPVLAAPLARTLAGVMRRVVIEGTGRSLKSVEPPMAGKTGTAEVQDARSHAWFVGFAPFGGAVPTDGAPGAEPFTRISFAVLVEHGGYGGSVAAPIAGQIVTAARELKIIQ